MSDLHAKRVISFRFMRRFFSIFVLLGFAALLPSCSSGDEPVDVEDVGEEEISEEDRQLIEELGY
jgi:hypothetical protein